jgi:hypothetical protein
MFAVDDDPEQLQTIEIYTLQEIIWIDNWWISGCQMQYFSCETQYTLA